MRSASPLPCSACHSLDGTVIIGPSHKGDATRAGTRVPGLSAEEYIRQSILDPGAFIVPGFVNVMPANYGETLTPQQIDNLVAFLLTLE